MYRRIYRKKHRIPQIFLVLFMALCCGFINVLGSTQIVLATPSKPNIIFLLVDDMGWKDTGCYGSTYYETPNIDALAAQGMRFTNAYASAPICSPTRASLLTGVSPATLRMTGVIGDPEILDRELLPATYDPLPYMPSDVCLNTAIPTQYNSFADVLKQQGYDTCYTGKWHSGTRTASQMGFDQVISQYDSVYHSAAAEAGYGDGTVTRSMTTDAVNYINQHSGTGDPFLLYVNYYTVHVPLQADQANVNYFDNYGTPDAYQYNSRYAAMLKELDNSVGSIMQAIANNDIDENTLVIFSSDNGGLTAALNPLTGLVESVTSQYPLRAGKGTLYEGGIRVPLIVHYPGVVPSQTVVDIPVSSEDFYPTIVNFGGGSSPSYVEGLSLKNIWTGVSSSLSRDALYFHYPYYKAGNQPVSAIRKGNYKLLYFWESDSFELYNLSTDVSEANNIAPSNISKVNELWTDLQNWLQLTNAPIPVARNYYSSQQLLANPGFETGTASDWTAETATLTVSSTYKRGGSYSMAISGRTATWSSCKQDTTDILNTQGAGVYYYCFYARLATGDSTNIQLKAHFEYKIGTDTPIQVQGSLVTLNTAWKKIEGTFTTNDFLKGDITSAIVRFASGSTYATTVYVDDFYLVKVSQLLTNSGFETGTTSGWEPETATLTVSSAYKNSGNYSLAVSSRTATWSSCKQDITAELNEMGPGVYYYSFYARLADGDGTNIQVKTHFEYKVGTNTPIQVQGSLVTLDNTWKKIEGVITTDIFTPGDITSALVRFASGSTYATTVYVDDFYLVKPQYLQNAGFEKASTAGWTAESATLSITYSMVNSGNCALAVSNRTYGWSSCKQDIAAVLNEQGPGKYYYSFYARLADGDSTSIQLKTHFEYKIGTGTTIQVQGTPVTLNSSWQKIQGTITTSDFTKGDITAAIVRFASVGTYDTTVYVDDFSLFK